MAGGAAGGTPDAGSFAQVQIWFIPTPNGSYNTPKEMVSRGDTVAVLGTRGSGSGSATYYAIPSLDGGLFVSEIINGAYDEAAGSIAALPDGGLFATFSVNDAGGLPPREMVLTKVMNFGMDPPPSLRAIFGSDSRVTPAGLWANGPLVGASGTTWDVTTYPGGQQYGGSGGRYAFLRRFDQNLLNPLPMRWVGCPGQSVEAAGSFQLSGSECLVFESACTPLYLLLDSAVVATVDAGVGTFSLCENPGGGAPWLTNVTRQPISAPTIVAESNRAWVVTTEASTSRYVVNAFVPSATPTIATFPVNQFQGRVKAASGFNDTTLLVGGHLTGPTQVGGSMHTPMGDDGFVNLHTGASLTVGDTVLLTGPGNETIEAVAFGADRSIWVAGTCVSGSMLRTMGLACPGGAFIARFTR